MRTIHDRASLQALRRDWCQRPQDVVAFVPTMGALHEGHLSLVRFGRERAALVVASIFVNPLQFDDSDDLERYPRDLERDALLLAEAGVDVLYAPDVEDMFPTSGRDAATPLVRAPVCAGDLEGRFRPGHFDGVVTVLTKLFNRVGPNLALFGEKDFQQLKVVESLVDALDFPIEIVGRPTVREADGLAVASRNVRLSSSQRALAPELYRALVALRSRLNESVGTSGRAAALDALGSALDATRVRLEESGFRVDYCEVRSAADFGPPGVADPDWVIVCAAHLASVRLIDAVRVFE